MPTATLTSKGQITLPIEMRRKLGLKAGDQIQFFEDAAGQYTVVPKTGSIMEMRGFLQKLGVPPLGYAPSVEEMDEAIMDYAVELDNATLSHAASQNEDGEAA